jgi:hypothetical protein
MNFPQQISNDVEKKKNSIMSNASKKTSRCNQIAKILIVIYYISHSHVKNIFTTLGYTQHFSLSSQVKSILMLIQAFQHIDKCKQLL